MFGNRVIEQVIRHTLGDTIKIQPADFMSVRVTFRRLGGSWEAVAAGDLKAIDVLKRVISAWGAMPHEDEKDELV